MDERHLRQEVAQAAQGLWMRGLVAGDEGAVSAEIHRRRYLVTPPGRRRSAIGPYELMVVDVGGVDINGDGSLTTDFWRLHRLAYQCERGRDLHENSTNHRALTDQPVRATVLASPPMVLALARLYPDESCLHLADMHVVPVLRAPDDAAVKTALEKHPALLAPPMGLLVTAHNLASALNLLEAIEHAATIEIACRGKR